MLDKTNSLLLSFLSLSQLINYEFLFNHQLMVCILPVLFPDLISDMLGSDKYKRSWQTALDSLQDPYINR